MNSRAKHEETVIAIPTVLFSEVQARCRELGFDGVTEYVVFVLTELIREDDHSQAVQSEQEEERLGERLRALGYLD